MGALTAHQSIYALTLQVNGTSKGVYNPASAAKTINIAVPTKTSDITNDSGFITSAAIPTALKNPYAVEIKANGASLGTYDGSAAATFNLSAANVGAASKVHSHNASEINGLPTNLSAFNNDVGYITGITKSMVEGVLTGNITSHTHTFASLTSKPTTISGYGITDAITAGNIGSQSVNYATNAGNADTLDGYHASSFYKHATAYPFGSYEKPWHKIATFSQSMVGLQINTSITFYVSEYYNSKSYGIFTVRARAKEDSASPEFLTVDFLVNAGIHKSDIVATWKNTGDGNIVINVYAYRVGWSSFSFRKIEEQAWGAPQDRWTTLNASYGNENCYASIPSDENQVVSTNIDIYNNVASATKLQTPRTIWGQSFDGSGDVSGRMSGVDAIVSNTTDGYYVGNRNDGLVDVTTGGLLLYSYNATPMSFYTNRTERMCITADGNILIGTTTDLNDRLQVYKAIGIQPIDGGYSGMFFYMNTGTKESWHISARGEEPNSPFRLYYSPYKSTYNAILDITKGGNILIGTTTDNGYKLQVNGSERVYGDLIVDGEVSALVA